LKSYRYNQLAKLSLDISPTIP